MANSDPHAAVSPRDALTRLLDGVQTLFREHLTLAFMNKAKQDKIALPRTGEELRRDREWLASLRETAERPGGRAPAVRAGVDRTTSASLPSGRAGATADLGPRSPSRSPGQPVAGATSTPDGEPMTAARNEPLRH